jgi:hypothetical protein
VKLIRLNVQLEPLSSHTMPVKSVTVWLHWVAVVAPLWQKEELHGMGADGRS